MSLAETLRVTEMTDEERQLRAVLASMTLREGSAERYIGMCVFSRDRLAHTATQGSVTMPETPVGPPPTIVAVMDKTVA